MSLDIATLYKKVLPIKNTANLTLEFAEHKQREFIESMIDQITPTQDPKVLLMITRLYIHFVSFGASPDVKKMMLLQV